MTRTTVKKIETNYYCTNCSTLIVGDVYNYGAGYWCEDCDCGYNYIGEQDSNGFMLEEVE